MAVYFFRSVVFYDSLVLVQALGLEERNGLNLRHVTKNDGIYKDYSVVPACRLPYKPKAN